MSDKKKVLFAAFEGLPFVKTGGLADVIYALPRAINSNKYEVRVILPLLNEIRNRWSDRFYYLDHIKVDSGYIHEEANIYNYYLDGIEYLFIENDTFFSRDNVYGYGDDACRFSFYNLAIIETLIKLDYYPDIIHEHDYHLGVLSALCKLKYADNENISKIKHVFTIHNLSYQGQYPRHVLSDFLEIDPKYYDDGTLRYGDGTNFLKNGIICSDIITTVSRTYAEEIKTPEYGFGMDEVLRYRENDLYGIVNGLDPDIWNPRLDDIKENFDARNSARVKHLNKKALQEKLHLEEGNNILLVGMVSRLIWQKGIEILIESVPEMLNKKVEVAVLGTGEENYVNALKELEKYNPGKVAYVGEYKDATAKDFYAGLDVLLMPSYFEPCGISQQIAMRYGTLPLVRETGGLKDTVRPYNKDRDDANGFGYTDNNRFSFLETFNSVYEVFKNKGEWKKLIKNAMNTDNSFRKSADEYQKLYRKVLGEQDEKV